MGKEVNCLNQKHTHTHTFWCKSGCQVYCKTYDNLTISSYF